MTIAKTAQLTGSAGSGTLLLDIDGTSLDTDGAVDTASDRWTCPTDGTYSITFNGIYYSTDTGTNPYCTVNIRVNGSSVEYTEVYNGSGGPIKQAVSLTAVESLTAGDYIDFYLSGIEAGSSWSYIWYGSAAIRSH